MDFTKFPQANCNMNFPPKFGNLQFPALHTKDSTTICLMLSDADIEQLTKGRRLWVTIYGPEMPPFAIVTNAPFYEAADAYHEIYYSNLATDNGGIWVFNNWDGPAPKFLKIADTLYLRDNDPKKQPIPRGPQFVVQKNAWYIRPIANEAEFKTIKAPGETIGHIVLCRLIADKEEKHPIIIGKK